MAAWLQKLPWEKLNQTVSIAPLITFRIGFGLLMFFSMLRFWWYGWITDLYVSPAFHFTYAGFEWVKPLGYVGMHVLFAVVAVAALFIAVGLFYRIACVTFFAGFVYIELIDAATYLNHYYFVSLMAFLLIWLPADRYYAVDVWLRPEKIRTEVPLLCIGILRFQMAVVYIFAGLAKINADWLLKALPLSIWLPAKSHLPVVGPLMYSSYTAFLFSWFGAAYDLFIVFFLLSGKTRSVAYLFVIIFHASTALLFPAIGMFPYIMMTCSLIFLSGSFHKKLLSFLPLYGHKRLLQGVAHPVYRYHYTKTMSVLLALYILAQALIPLRFLLYPGHLFWNEDGYRFSWRVMLMEKSGTAYFTVKSASNQASYEVNNREFLTTLQEKMMSTQPDLILQFAHFLSEEYEKRGLAAPAVTGEVYVSLNGRHSRLFIDPSVDLARESFSWKHYGWVLPYKQ
jgi:hypothetical protein